MLDAQVEVQGSDIIVTMAGTSFRVAYRKPAGLPWLIASDFVRDDRDTLVSVAEFQTQAWRLANDKARELGWIV